MVVEKKARRGDTAAWDPECLFHAFTEYGGSSYLTIKERVPLSVEHTRLARASTKTLANAPSARCMPAYPAYTLINSLYQFPTLQRLTLVLVTEADEYLLWGIRLPPKLASLCVSSQRPLFADFFYKLRLHTLVNLHTLELGCNGAADIDVVKNLLTNTELQNVQRLTVKAKGASSSVSAFDMLGTVMDTTQRLPRLSALCVQVASNFMDVVVPIPFLRAAERRRLDELKIVCRLCDMLVIPSDVDFPPPENMAVVLALDNSVYLRDTILHHLRRRNPCLQAWGMRMLIGIESDKILLIADWPVEYICHELISTLKSGVRDIACAVIPPLMRMSTTVTEHKDILQRTRENMMEFVKAAQDIVFAQTLVKILAVDIETSQHPLDTTYRVYFDIAMRVIQHFKAYSLEAKPALRVLSFVLFRMDVHTILSYTGRTVTEWASMLLCKTGPTLDIYLGLLLNRCDFSKLGSKRIQRLAIFQACQVSFFGELPGFLTDQVLETDVPGLLLESRSKEHDMFPHIYKSMWSRISTNSRVEPILRGLASTEKGKSQYWDIVMSPDIEIDVLSYVQTIIQVGFTYNVPGPLIPLDVPTEIVQEYLVEHLLGAIDDTPVVSHEYVVQTLVCWRKLYTDTMMDLRDELAKREYLYSKTYMKEILRSACVLYLLADYNVVLLTDVALVENCHRLYDAFYQIMKQLAKNMPLARLYFRGFKRLVSVPLTEWPRKLVDHLESMGL